MKKVIVTKEVFDSLKVGDVVVISFIEMIVEKVSDGIVSLYERRSIVRDCSFEDLKGIEVTITRKITI